MTVEHVRAGEVLKLQRRSVEIDHLSQYQEIGLRSFGRGIFHKEPTTGIQLGNKRVFWIEPGDLVLSNVFAWEGAIGVAGEAEAGLIGSHRFMTFTITDGRIDPSWARWWFLSEPGLALIGNASPGSAGRNRTLAIERFEALEIPLPPIQEQRRAAARLDRLKYSLVELEDDQIRARKVSLAVAASIMKRPGRYGEAKLEDTWKEVRLGDVLGLKCHEEPVNLLNSYKIAGVYSFGRGLFPRTVIEGSQIGYRVLHRLHRDQIVMSRLKAWEGAIALVESDFEGYYLSPEFPTFDIDVGCVEPAYLGALLTDNSFWSELRTASKGIGARRERVSASRLLERTIHLPDPRIQRLVVQRLQEIRTAETRRRAVSERITALLPAALNEAFGNLS